MIEIVQRMFSDHNKIQLESHKNKILREKNTNIGNLNNKILNNPWIKEEIKGEIRQYVKWIMMKIQHMNMCDTAKATLKGKHIALNACIRKERGLLGTWIEWLG